MQDEAYRLVNTVRQTIAEQQLLQQGDRVVAAVSGGPDSVALLHALAEISQEFDARIVVGHVNHGLRGEESDAEQRYVEHLTARLGLLCECRHVDVRGALRLSGGGNVQETARTLRYEALAEIAASCGASKIALGHHADDQAETVLMRIIRGTGVSGLRGIPVRRKLSADLELIRPLLRIRKETIEAYCSMHQLEPRMDSSNEKRDYTRNAVRLDVIPYLSNWNPQLASALQQLTDMATADDDYMEAEAVKACERVVRKEYGGYTADRSALLSLHIALQRRLIKLILNYLFSGFSGWDYEGIERIRVSISAERPSTIGFDIGSGFRFEREYEQLYWGVPRHSGDTSDYLYAVTHEGGCYPLPCADAALQVERFNGTRMPEPHSNLYEAYFDAEALLFPLYVRSRKPGDRIRIFGLSGSKKVKDILIDRKVPPSERDRLPLVTDAEGRILWIPGLARSDTALLVPDSKRILRLQLVKGMHSM